MELVDQISGNEKIPFIGRNSDILLAAGVVGIVIFMVIPLPPILLDLLLAFNITFALLVLLLGMYIMQPLELSSFPSILLLITLFRLSLNIASTRLILLHGHEGATAAGAIIKSFGAFVVGGNYGVGIIVFLILVVINFVVITKGAGRIAEVAARFTLDAMPGKQMSIDADLNAGIITEDEARIRREVISREAEYYGAMDGANKFVRGDAVAGIIITLINIIGGLAIGMLQHGMVFTEAAQNYTLLTVGDGLVTQIPALIISTAAGVIVSRAGSSNSMGKEITSQVLVQPRAIGISSCVIFTFALVPGLPSIPFFVLGLVTAGLAYSVHQAGRKTEEQEKDLIEAQSEPVQPVETLPPLDVLAIEVGYGLIPLVDTEQNGELLDRIKSVRRQFAQDIGIVVSPIHIQDNIQLKPGAYTIRLKGNIVAQGELMANNFLAMDPGSVADPVDGIETREPTYGLPAIWIKASDRERAIAAGYTVVDPATVLTTHLSEVIRRHAHELLGRQELQQLIDNLKTTHPKVVEELIPNLLPLGAVARVLQNLLREQVPIRDLLAILETLADWAPSTKDAAILTEYVRQALARTITKLHECEEGFIPVLTVDQQIEKTVADSIQRTEQGIFAALDPMAAEKIINDLARKIETQTQRNYQPVVLCSAQIRLHVQKLVERFLPDLRVLAYEEILPTAEIRALGTVELTHAD